ncbi:MAG TPA: PepSY domain-containing protein [Steroidobacteraceae bacterium]
MPDRRLPRIAWLAALAAVVTIAWLPEASAQTPAQQMRPAAHSAGPMTLDQAVKMAEQRFKARVVRAQSRKDDGHTTYVLRLLNDSGRVWTVRINAANGSVL